MASRKESIDSFRRLCAVVVTVIGLIMLGKKIKGDNKKIIAKTFWLKDNRNTIMIGSLFLRGRVSTLAMSDGEMRLYYSQNNPYSN